jgi:serine/threonine protein kinase
MCAPNDVWSLGVILVNLTCGRNPWKQASFQDSTYRAYARSSDFLKTILPLTDELNSILGAIFTSSPEQRITLPQLRQRILACSRFTMPAGVAAPLTPPASPEHMAEYVYSETAVVDDYDSDSSLSPTSTTSDDCSLTSSVSTIEDLDDEFVQDQHVPQQQYKFAPQTYDQLPAYTGQEFVPQQQQQQQHYIGPMPPTVVPQQPMMCQPVPTPMPIQATHMPVQAPCQPVKAYNPLWDNMVKYVSQVPMMQHPMGFHQQVAFLPAFQGCY